MNDSLGPIPISRHSASRGITDAVEAGGRLVFELKVGLVELAGQALSRLRATSC